MTYKDNENGMAMNWHVMYSSGMKLKHKIMESIENQTQRLWN